MDHLTKSQQDMGASKFWLPASFKTCRSCSSKTIRTWRRKSRKELTNLGCHVRVAETETEGLAAARSHPAALFIVDRMLKGTIACQ